jgi:hypothetical protein
MYIDSGPEAGLPGERTPITTLIFGPSGLLDASVALNTIENPNIAVVQIFSFTPEKRQEIKVARFIIPQAINAAGTELPTLFKIVFNYLHTHGIAAVVALLKEEEGRRLEMSVNTGLLSSARLCPAFINNRLAHLDGGEYEDTFAQAIYFAGITNIYSGDISNYGELVQGEEAYNVLFVWSTKTLLV